MPLLLVRLPFHFEGDAVTSGHEVQHSTHEPNVLHSSTAGVWEAGAVGNCSPQSTIDGQRQDMPVSGSVKTSNSVVWSDSGNELAWPRQPMRRCRRPPKGLASWLQRGVEPGALGNDAGRGMAALAWATR